MAVAYLTLPCFRGLRASNGLERATGLLCNACQLALIDAEANKAAAQQGCSFLQHGTPPERPARHYGPASSLARGSRSR